MRVCLVQLWIGAIPEYFKYHYTSLKYQRNIDFYLITDQDIDMELYPFYKVYKTSIEDVYARFKIVYGREILFTSNKKLLDLKVAYFDLFSDIIYFNQYEYVGFYDMDIEKVVLEVQNYMQDIYIKGNI